MNAGTAADRRDERLLVGQPEPGDEAVAAILDAIRADVARQPMPEPSAAMQAILRHGLRRPVPRVMALRVKNRIGSLTRSVRAMLLACLAWGAAAGIAAADIDHEIPGSDLLGGLVGVMVPDGRDLSAPAGRADESAPRATGDDDGNGSLLAAPSGLWPVGDGAAWFQAGHLLGPWLASPVGPGADSGGQGTQGHGPHVVSGSAGQTAAAGDALTTAESAPSAPAEVPSTPQQGGPTRTADPPLPGENWQAPGGGLEAVPGPVEVPIPTGPPGDGVPRDGDGGFETYPGGYAPQTVDGSSYLYTADTAPRISPHRTE